jgi:hypothetical protein
MKRPPRLEEIWEQVKLRLDTARMQSFTRGAKRIYLESDDYAAPESGIDLAWGRAIIVPTQTAWPTTEAPGQMIPVAFLVRGEVNDFKDPGFHKGKVLSGIQDETYAQLYGWTPSSSQALVVLQIFLFRPPQPLPLWEEGRGVWFTSAEYRCWVSST